MVRPPDELRLVVPLQTVAEGARIGDGTASTLATCSTSQQRRFERVRPGFETLAPVLLATFRGGFY